MSWSLPTGEPGAEEYAKELPASSGLIWQQERERAAGVVHEVGARAVLDDIAWDDVARQHGSRSASQCKLKWYGCLSPSMVARGAPSLPPACMLLLLPWCMCDTVVMMRRVLGDEGS